LFGSSEVGRSDSDAETVAKEFLAKTDRITALEKKEKVRGSLGRTGIMYFFGHSLEELLFITLALGFFLGSLLGMAWREEVSTEHHVDYP
jgi:hypothetical protein